MRATIPPDGDTTAEGDLVRCELPTGRRTTGRRTTGWRAAERLLLTALLVVVAGCTDGPSAAQVQQQTRAVLQDLGLANLPVDVVAGPTEVGDREGCVTQKVHRIVVSLDVRDDDALKQHMVRAWEGLSVQESAGGDQVEVERDGYRVVLSIDPQGEDSDVLLATSPCYGSLSPVEGS